MYNASFDFDDFADSLTLKDDVNTVSWPSLGVEMYFIFHPAEPDVGIFHEQIEVCDITFHAGGLPPFNDEDDFIAAVYRAIGKDVEEPLASVAKIVRKQLRQWETEIEEKAEDYI